MRGILTIVGLIMLNPAHLRADDTANQLTLADLAAYRVALSGKATADGAREADPPISASFRDLWDKADTLKGRRVEIRGRIERVFRQGPVGQFPALVQAWAFSPAGDPFCLVYPDPSHSQIVVRAGRLHPAGAGGTPAPQGLGAGGTPAPQGSNSPNLGAETRFTGTFLKVVEYPAGDGPRLAPMIVGDRPPLVVKKAPAVPRTVGKSAGVPEGSWSSTEALIGLVAAMAVVGILATRHLRSGIPPRRRVWRGSEVDPPLEFVSSERTTGGTS